MIPLIKKPWRKGVSPPRISHEPSARRVQAVLLALLVTFLWSTSWILIKFGLKDIPALTFAGLRYGLAFLVLLPFALRGEELQKLRALPPGMWARLALLGLLYYAVTQGAQFLGLAYLPAMTNSLLLSFSAVLVALLGVALLGERPTKLQWVGMALYLAGVLLYFYPLSIPAAQTVGYLIVIAGVLANAFSSILGRAVNRSASLRPVTITLVSMGIGSLLLLVSGLAVQGLPRLSLQSWGIILWLAVINSALAFTLWNHTLRTLSAMESSIINNTMLFQIAILAWIFLGERLGARGIAGMLLAGVGTLLVQLRR